MHSHLWSHPIFKPWLHLCVVYKALLENIVLAVDNGGRRLPMTAELGYTREQAEAIHRLKHGKDDYQRLGLHYDASRYAVINLFLITFCVKHSQHKMYCDYRRLTVCLSIRGCIPSYYTITHISM